MHLKVIFFICYFKSLVYLPLASLFMPIIGIKRAIESVLSVFCMEEVEQES